jgi:hypothetical protein
MPVILFKKRLVDLEVKGQRPTRVITVHDTPSYGHAPTCQISLTKKLLSGQDSYSKFIVPETLTIDRGEAEVNSQGRGDKKLAIPEYTVYKYFIIPLSSLSRNPDFFVKISKNFIKFKN